VYSDSYEEAGLIRNKWIAIACMVVGLLAAGIAIGVLAEKRVHDHGRPTIAIVNACQAVTNGGTLKLDSSGFSPGGYYLTIVWRGDSVYLDDWGQADVFGKTSSWHWPCDADSKPGQYKVQLLDEQAGRMSNKVGFTVQPPPTATSNK